MSPRASEALEAVLAQLEDAGKMAPTERLELLAAIMLEVAVKLSPRQYCPRCSCPLGGT